MSNSNSDTHSIEELILFDFDGTITSRDTLFPMALYFSKTEGIIPLSRYLLFYLGLRLKLITNESLKKQFANCFFKGKDVNQVTHDLKKFFGGFFKYNDEVYQRFDMAVKKKQKVIIVSANFNVVINSWLKSLNIDSVEVVATELIKQGNFFTGKISGDVCRGEVKAIKLNKIINIERYYITSYADEVSDSYIMSLADKQCWV